MRTLPCLVLCAALPLSAVGCDSKASKEDCEKAADNLVDIAINELKAGNDDVPEAAIEAAKEAAGKTRDSFMATCEKSKKKDVECIAGAKDSAALAECKKAATGK